MCWLRMPASAMYWSVNSARAPGTWSNTSATRFSRKAPRRPGLEDLGEGVVLLLCDLQERDVVEQESLELVGRQVEELVAGTVQETFLSLPISEGTCRPFVMASYLSFGPGPIR